MKNGRGLSVLLIVASVFLQACSEDVSENGIKILTGSAGVVYGSDTRLDINSPIVGGYQLDQQIRATGALISKSLLTYNDQTSTDMQGLTLKEEQNLCKDSRFSEQKSSSFCSGVLVGPKLFLTAGHCLGFNERSTLAEDCAAVAIVFDRNADDGNVIPLQNIYGCKKVLERSERDGLNGSDHMLIELDREVTGRTPISVSLSNQAKVGEEIFLVGHPSGLPKKVSTAQILQNYKGDITEAPSVFSLANTDSFSGDSGAPIFSQEDRRLVGLLIGGEDDYEFDEVNNCSRVKVCLEDGSNCAGEKINRLSPETRQKIETYNQQLSPAKAITLLATVMSPGQSRLQ